MGIDIPNATTTRDLGNPRWWAKTLKQSKTEVTDGTITDASFSDRGGNSVIGRAGGTAGKPADIGLAPNQFLGNRAGTLVGTTIADSDLPSTITRDAELAAAISAHDADSTAHAVLSSTAQFVLAGELFT
jgi:hypothetical protein